MGCVTQKPVHPSFGMTPTKDIRDLFAKRRPSIPTCVGPAVSFQMGTFCVNFFTSGVVTDVSFTFLLQGRGAAGRGWGRGGRTIQL